MTEFPRIEEEIEDLKNILRRSNLTKKGFQLLEEYEYVLSKVKNLALSGVGCSLPDAKKEEIIEEAYTLNLQNLSGREDFEEAFRLGIEIGINELSENLNK